nr:MAG TPA: hypothetical protein [Caudoviricetes sp.]
MLTDVGKRSDGQDHLFQNIQEKKMIHSYYILLEV